VRIIKASIMAVAAWSVVAVPATAMAAQGQKSFAGRAFDKTRELAGKAADKTKAITFQALDRTQEVADLGASRATDGLITTKVTAKFADDIVLDGNRINVDTRDRVVTLKGTVATAAARDQAERIASGTRGVAKVVNNLIVK